MLGGVEIPHDRGLEGHSDGDALLHALTDAVLGAVGAPDIGSLFPSGDPKWREAPSRIFLDKAKAVAGEKGHRVTQVDAVLIAEEPRLAGHFDSMRSKIAEILGLAVEDVAVKATTTDGMGFTGRREGIAAQAVVLMAKAED
jgi:2-C-methyl-D-erythritol 4-phosphate cytidylyltransferase/2-C-methyl-D-erythritol 2,4-cyclodiphosphate synthase